MCQSLTGSYVQGPWCQGIYGVIWELKTEFGVNPELFPFTYSDWQSEIYEFKMTKSRNKRDTYILHTHTHTHTHIYIYMYVYVIIDIQHIAQLA